jgi:hypothetical protein
MQNGFLGTGSITAINYYEYELRIYSHIRLDTKKRKLGRSKKPGVMKSVSGFLRCRLGSHASTITF